MNESHDFEAALEDIGEEVAESYGFIGAALLLGSLAAGGGVLAASPELRQKVSRGALKLMRGEKPPKGKKKGKGKKPKARKERSSTAMTRPEGAAPTGGVTSAGGASDADKARAAELTSQIASMMDADRDDEAEDLQDELFDLMEKIEGSDSEWEPPEDVLSATEAYGKITTDAAKEAVQSLQRRSMW